MSYGELSSVEGCRGCWCCTQCQLACSGSCGSVKETEDDVVCRILNIDPNCEAIRSAANHRRRFVEATEELFSNTGGFNETVDDSEGHGSESGDGDAELE